MSALYMLVETQTAEGKCQDQLSLANHKQALQRALHNVVEVLSQFDFTQLALNDEVSSRFLFLFQENIKMG